MTIEELLQTQLMHGAKLIAGAEGIMREVMWCADDTDPMSTNGVIPGLLLLVTSQKPEKLFFDRYLDHLGRTMVAGIAFFESEEPTWFTPEEIDHAMRRYDRLKIPVIKLPRGTNRNTFKNQFTITYSRYYSAQRRRENWLREICEGSGLIGGETLAQTYGFSAETYYYCMIVEPRNAREYDRTPIELEVEAVKNHLKRELSTPGARVLYYLGNNRLVLFFPWEEEPSPSLKRLINKTVTEMCTSYPNLEWQVAVGSIAHRITDFRTSFERAARTMEITRKLGVYERASYYDDWYLHMLLLDDSPDELHEHAMHVLSPISDSPVLMDTLSSFLVYGENLRETSQRVGVPESTFKYRLRRVEQLMGVNLDDPGTRFRLRMALTIERFLRD